MNPRPKPVDPLEEVKKFCKVLARLSGRNTSAWRLPDGTYVYQEESWPMAGTKVWTAQTEAK